jgi:NADH-quinone oxidoreductase subunit A
MMVFEYSMIANDCLAFLVFFVIAVFLTILILILSYLLAKQNPDSEKLTSYECGFEPYEDSRHIFDVRFCVIAIIFVIFDIEMLFLIPWSVSVSNLTLLGFWSMIDFLFELGIGFFYLLYVNALNWE